MQTELIASLDISIQAQIVMLFKKLQKESSFHFVLCHDLSMVRFLSDPGWCNEKRETG